MRRHRRPLRISHRSSSVLVSFSLGTGHEGTLMKTRNGSCRAAFFCPPVPSVSDGASNFQFVQIPYGDRSCIPPTLATPPDRRGGKRMLPSAFRKTDGEWDTRLSQDMVATGYEQVLAHDCEVGNLVTGSMTFPKTAEPSANGARFDHEPTEWQSVTPAIAQACHAAGSSVTMLADFGGWAATVRDDG
jgi:hypothetical protein